MTQIIEETEKSEDEEEEEEHDFDTINNQNLTINMPKHIKDSFQQRKTELELMTGTVYTSPLKLNVEDDESNITSTAGIGQKGEDLAKKIGPDQSWAFKSGELAAPFVSQTSTEIKRWKSQGKG